ncbi:MAG TPA: TfoX/Sxy family protein [Candidatus Lokiarchaeia archaeon]|nr:TfoX/Sxy family protein [Candidatus Lokiarchaeia archaeon]
MQWKKAPEDLVELVAVKMKDVPCQYRKMFGYPAYFINGNMFIGMFADKIFIRLSKEDIAELQGTHDDITPFEPVSGRAMKDYVVLPPEIYQDEELFTSLIAKSVEHTSSLLEKKKKKKK